MSAEFRVREELVRSLDMISHELRSIHAAFDGQRLSVHRLLVSVAVLLFLTCMIHRGSF